MTSTTPAPKSGSVALITGGTGGFGRALATKLKAVDVTVVLADLDVQEAAATVETVVERIEGLLSSPISVGPVELRADASIGVAIYPLDAREQDDLLGAADAAMYRRKHAAIQVA